MAASSLFPSFTLSSPLVALKHGMSFSQGSPTILAQAAPTTPSTGISYVCTPVGSTPQPLIQEQKSDHGSLPSAKWLEVAKQNATLASRYQGSSTIPIEIPTLLAHTEPKFDKPIRSRVSFVESCLENAVLDSLQKDSTSRVGVLHTGADAQTPGGQY